MSSPFSFTHYGSNNGLASNEINSVVQDRSGYLWIATNRGLQRFDGVQYKTFRHQEGNRYSLADNVLQQLLIDKDDVLWVLDAKGHVGRFNRSNFTYQPVAVKPRLTTSLGLEKRLIVDEFHNLFLLFRGRELIQYDKKKNEFSSAATLIPLPSQWGVTSMSQQPGTQKYWVGLQSGGIAIYNAKNGNLSYAGHNVEHEPAIEVIHQKIGFTHSFFDSKGRVWFEKWGGGSSLCMQYDPARKKEPLQTFEFTTALQTYHELYGFMQQRDGRVWIRGLQLFGVFNEEQNKFDLIPNDFKREQGIVYQTPTCLYEDREGNVWVGTRNNGLYRTNPSQQYFTNISHTNWKSGLKGEGTVMSFIQTGNGDLLTGTWGDGLYRYDKNFALLPLNIKGYVEAGYPSIWDMVLSEDKDVIWMATQPGGIFKYTQSKGSGVFYKPPVFQNRTVRQIVRDRQGKLWMGMNNFGLFQWDPAPGKEDFEKGLSKITSLPDVMVNQLLLDDYGCLWVITGAHGVYALDASTGAQLLHLGSGTRQQGIGDAVTGALVYNDSLIAFSNLTAIYFYNRFTSELSTFIAPETLAGNIASMEKDSFGNVWASTTNALYRISASKTIMQFDRADGITNDRFVMSASYALADGRLLFGNVNEFVSFRPSAINTKKKLPAVAVTGFKVLDRSLSVDSILALERLELHHSDNSINVYFSSLLYAAVYPVRYKLQGLDKDWRVADKSMNALYSYLPPGRYTLMLQVIDPEGKLSGNQTSLNIVVQTPFWKSWWFYSLLGIGAAFLLYWLDRQRMQRKEAMQKVRTDIAGGLHQDVNNALNNINILSEIARLKWDNEPQKAKEYVEQIQAKSHNMIIALDDMLWSLAPENDTMEKTILRVKEFADALTQRHGTSIELGIDKKVERLQLDMKLRHEAFLLFKEGLRSLVEAGTPNCTVHLALERGKLIFTIEFENRGCDMQQLNNLLQRRDLEDRLDALNAKVDVQLHKSRSVFMLQLPL